MDEKMVALDKLIRASVSENIPVSIIIPCHRDIPYLISLLVFIQNWQESAIEIIVVLSHDTSPVPQFFSLVNEMDIKIIYSEANRGLQSSKGADLASGSILWFLHADTVPDTHSIVEIRRAICENYDGGAFSFAFSGERKLIKKILSALVKLRCRIGVPYSDQGIFISREFYQASNGFEHWPLFEEVLLVKDVRKNGRFVILDNKIKVDSRRWEENGWLRTSLLNQIFVLAFKLGISPKRIARWYRYGNH